MLLPLQPFGRPNRTGDKPRRLTDAAGVGFIAMLGVPCVESITARRCMDER